MNGFVVGVGKESTWTSHDAVQKLRCALGVQEIGHAGSLDPFATGVLVCGVGRGTKIVSYLMDLRKEYSGTMRLGVETDSGDITGETIGERPVPAIDPETARAASKEFVGKITQIPPMVSAIKHQGQRLYDLARKGIEVERMPRSVEVHSFEITAVSGNEVHFSVVCGKGTYIRALARDFAEKLGTVACLSRLQRDAVGSFRIECAVNVDAPYAEIVEGVRARAVSLPRALSHVPSLHLRPEWVRRVRQGSQPPWRATDVAEMPDARYVQLLGPEEELIAIASIEAVPGPADCAWRDAWELKLERVL